jgi:hypothetical protein
MHAQSRQKGSPLPWWRTQIALARMFWMTWKPSSATHLKKLPGSMPGSSLLCLVALQNFADLIHAGESRLLHRITPRRQARWSGSQS